MAFGTIVGGVGFPFIYVNHPDFKTDAMQRSAERLCGITNTTQNATETIGYS